MSAIAVELNGITRIFGGRHAVNRLSLQIKQGEFVSFLGPSGCGKTTTLNMIAGFMEPDEGEIRLAGEKVNGFPPYRRNIGVVFQSYALFPHMSVFENVAYGLKIRKVPKDEVARRVHEALAIVRLEGMAERKPAQLSGGQQQRVAMARALVIRPSLLLLDEPLSNLDAKLRDEMRVELKEIQRKIGITTIFVTHDQDEALAISDRIVVMNNGSVEQIGTPEEVYEEPATEFVQRFIGMTNAVTGTAAGREAEFLRIRFASGAEVWGMAKGEIIAGKPAQAFVRPERIAMEPLPEPSGKTSGKSSGIPGQQRKNLLAGQVTFSSYQGSTILYKVHTDCGELLVRTPTRRYENPAPPGARVNLSWDAADTRCSKTDAKESDV
ncbi:ABC transporter ATP-binding protein [Paenibacillus hamazuiensis]|uniref:ABC transporter ATP-binding protein n=1 Tax=Paenibacillus hamazuiensis TaxID=2936508 RepID=UPI0023DEC4CD|nr:ABC transporter ATP-binding protein [Paenibacillus hamazuiensis]